MSNSILGIGISGMRSYQRALDSSANNIANANTPAYQPRQLVFQQGSSGSGVSLASIATPGSGPADRSGADLATDLVDSMVYKSGFDFSAEIVKTADAMLGTLIDISA